MEGWGSGSSRCRLLQLLSKSAGTGWSIKCPSPDINMFLRECSSKQYKVTSAGLVPRCSKDFHLCLENFHLHLLGASQPSGTTWGQSASVRSKACRESMRLYLHQKVRQRWKDQVFIAGERKSPCGGAQLPERKLDNGNESGVFQSVKVA